MLNSSILDVAIGMAFIYLLLSLIASTLQEAIASLLQIRPANLEHGIHSLFSGGTLLDGETTFTVKLYRHGLIMGLYREHAEIDGKNTRTSPVRDWLRQLFRVPVRAKGTPANPVEHSPAYDWILLQFRPFISWAGRPFRPLLRFTRIFRVPVRRQQISVKPCINDLADPYLLPAYIPARTFAMALLDILKVESAIRAEERSASTDSRVGDSSATGSKKPDPLQPMAAYLLDLCDPLKCNVDKSVPPQQKSSSCGHPAAEAMLALLKDAQDIDSTMPPIEKFRCHLENWYNDSMDRASGWYTKYTHNVLLVIGLLLAIAFNVDSIHVGKTLWFDKDVRSNLINAAGKYVEKNTPDARAGAKDQQTALDQQQLTKQMSTTVAAFNEVSRESLLPVGWHYKHETYEAYKQRLFTPRDWILNPVHWAWRDVPNWNWPKLSSMFAGWSITALAISLGASFWFDLLNKFMVVRSTVKPSEKSRTEASKDAS